MATMANDLGPDSVVSNVEDLAEYQELKNEHYTPFNLGSESPAQNQFYSDKDDYPELPALFSTQGTRFQKRGALGEINWASLKDPLAFDDHPHAVKVVAARFRKDFPLECKAIDESSSGRLPYYFDDLDLYHWGPKFLRRVIQCICDEKNMLHAEVLRFAIHLIATDAPRARQIAYFGRAAWYHEEVTQYGGEFLEEVSKFFTHRDDVIHKLTECSNKYLEEARGDSYMRPMYYDQVFRNLNEARTVRLCHSAFKGPVLMHYVSPPSAPDWTGCSAKSDTDHATGTLATSRALGQEHRGTLPSVQSGTKSLHRRRTSSLSTVIITTEHQAKTNPLLHIDNHGSAMACTSSSFDTNFRGSEQTLAGNFVDQKAIRKLDVSAASAAGKDTKVQGIAEFDGQNADGSSHTEQQTSGELVPATQPMTCTPGNQKQLPKQHQSKHPHPKQSSTTKPGAKKPADGSPKANADSKLDDSFASSPAIQGTHGSTHESGSPTVKPSKGKKNHKNNKRKASGLRNDARAVGALATPQEPSFDHARKSSTSRSILDEDDSIISVTMDGEKRISPNISPQAPKSEHVHMPPPPHAFQNNRTSSGSSGGIYQPRTRPWGEFHSQSSGYVYANEPSVPAAHPWQQYSIGSGYQAPPMPYMVAQNSEVSYDTEYQTQWAPPYSQPPVPCAGSSGKFTGGSFYGSAPPLTNSGYQHQPFNPQAGSFRQHNQTPQHYQQDSHYGRQENRKRYPENMRHNYDRFSNRHWNNHRGYRRDNSQNGGSTYGASFDPAAQRNYQPEYSSSTFERHNRNESQNSVEQNHQVNSQDEGLITSEDSFVTNPIELLGNITAETVADSEVPTNIKYPILYPVVQPVPNTPVVSRELSTSASPKGVQDKAICNVDLDAVNIELQSQSKDILASERNEEVSSQAENQPAVRETQSGAAIDTTQNVSSNAHEHANGSGKKAAATAIRSSSMLSNPTTIKNKVTKQKLVSGPSRSEDDAQFPSLEFANSQVKSKHNNLGTVRTQKTKETSKPVHADPEQTGVVPTSHFASTSQRGPTTQSKSPKEVTTVLTLPTGRRSPSARLPQHGTRFSQHNVTNQEDPYKLYVSGPGLDNDTLTRIFGPYRPTYITAVRDSKWVSNSKPDVPPNTRYAFVTFDSIEECQEARQALSGKVWEGTELRISRAMARYGDIVKDKIPTNSARPAGYHTSTRKPSNTVGDHPREPQLHNTKMDNDTKHKRSFSTSSKKANASGNHSPKGIAGTGTHTVKVSRNNDSLTANRPIASFSPPVDQVLTLPNSIAGDTDEVGSTTAFGNTKQCSVDSLRQAEATTTSHPENGKAGLQLAVVTTNDQSEDKCPVVKDSAPASPALADHPPIAGRIKKTKTKQGKKQKRRSKDINIGSNRDEAPSSTSSEFPLNLDDSGVLSFATTIEDNGSPLNGNEAETGVSTQNMVTTQSLSTGQEIDTMIWEPTDNQSKHSKAKSVTELGNLAHEKSTMALEAETTESNGDQQSRSTIDTACSTLQVIDLASSTPISATSEETIGHEEHLQSTNVVITNPGITSLPPPTRDTEMYWSDSTQLVNLERLVNDGEGIERTIEQYPDPLTVPDQDDTSRGTLDLSMSVESSLPSPASGPPDIAMEGSGRPVDNNDITSPVESNATDKTTEAADDTQGWDASVRVSNSSSKKKRRKSRRSSKNTNASDSDLQIGKEFDTGNQQSSSKASDDDIGGGSPSAIKHHAAA